MALKCNSFLFHRHSCLVSPKRDGAGFIPQRHPHACVQEGNICEVSRGGEELLLCAGLWEVIASHLKVSCQVYCTLMFWNSGVFQKPGVSLCLLFVALHKMPKKI